MAKPKHDDIEKFHDYDLHVPTRTIYVGTLDRDDCDTGPFMAERLIKNLMMLGDTTDPITIIMNNLGGYHYSCTAMIDAIQAKKAHVTIIGMGALMSAGSIMFQAADHRVMSANCSQMLHYGTSGGQDHVKNTIRAAAEDMRLNKWLEQWYLKRIREKHPTFTLAKVKKMLEFDTYLSAEESVELGLADAILGQD